jgi:carbon monoxide dehydrogenase subunit G
MGRETSFDVAVPPQRVFAFLSNPRNLITANHPGPVIERSDGPFSPGSWFLLAFDQIRVRVEYPQVEPNRRLAAAVTMSGRGSGGASSRWIFDLSELDGGGGTRVEASAEGSMGWLRWGPLNRALKRRMWRSLSKRIEARA